MRSHTAVVVIMWKKMSPNKPKNVAETNSAMEEVEPGALKEEACN